MSTIYERCPDEVRFMAAALLCTQPEHKPLVDNKVTIDYLFATAEEDVDGNPKGYALKLHGVKSLAICRRNTLKARALGLSDAEICIDKEWWEGANEKEQAALLDHELYHLEVKETEEGVQKDDLGRPKLNIRKHDYQFGWFNHIAKRHGIHSQERKQAAQLMDDAGQYYWNLGSLTKAAFHPEVKL